MDRFALGVGSSVPLCVTFESQTHIHLASNQSRMCNISDMKPLKKLRKWRTFAGFYIFFDYSASYIWEILSISIHQRVDSHFSAILESREFELEFSIRVFKCSDIGSERVEMMKLCAKSKRKPGSNLSEFCERFQLTFN